MTSAAYGGYYGLMPHSSGGFVGWTSDGVPSACAQPASVGIVIGIIACVLFVILIAAIVYYGKVVLPKKTSTVVKAVPVEGTSTASEGPAAAGTEMAESGAKV